LPRLITYGLTADFKEERTNTMSEKFLVTSSPHIHSDFKTSSIMLDVIIALIPAGLAGIFYFGIKCLLIITTSIASCVVFEFLWNKFMKQKTTVGDLSAVVTGLLLAYNMPPTIPVWMVVVGSFFAIIIVKQFFGGIGNNFMNPALAARAFMLASWAGFMAPSVWQSPSLMGMDSLTGATPLSMLKEGGEQLKNMPGMERLFMGDIEGCIGETSACLLLIGGLYLWMRGVIKARIPVSFIATVAVCTFLFGGADSLGDRVQMMGWHVLSGGLFLGAIFMATDYTTSPVTPKGQIIMGIGCGLITSLIRLKGGYPEGTTYAILLMNVLTPLIDRYTAPRVFGTKTDRKEKMEKKIMEAFKKRKSGKEAQ